MNGLWRCNSGRNGRWRCIPGKRRGAGSPWGCSFAGGSRRHARTNIRSSKVTSKNAKWAEVRGDRQLWLCPCESGVRGSNGHTGHNCQCGKTGKTGVCMRASHTCHTCHHTCHRERDERETHKCCGFASFEKPWFTFSVLSYWLAGTVLPVVQAGAFRGA